MDRRLKIMRLGSQYLMDLLVPGAKVSVTLPDGRIVETTILESVPPGAVVKSCNANWAMNGIDLMIEHESFPIVPNGDYPPDMWMTIHTEVICPEATEILSESM